MSLDATRRELREKYSRMLDEMRRERSTPGAKIEANARKYFGVTNNILRAGYILRDGTMLDFGSELEQGRIRDHREVSFAFPEDYKHTMMGESRHDVLGDFVRETGALRMGAYVGYKHPGECDGAFFELHTEQEPTSQQWKTLGVVAGRCAPALSYDIYYGKGNSEAMCANGYASTIGAIRRDYERCKAE